VDETSQKKGLKQKV